MRFLCKRKWFWKAPRSMTAREVRSRKEPGSQRKRTKLWMRSYKYYGHNEYMAANYKHWIIRKITYIRSNVPIYTIHFDRSLSLINHRAWSLFVRCMCVCCYALMPYRVGFIAVRIIKIAWNTTKRICLLCVALPWSLLRSIQHEPHTCRSSA